MRKEKEQQQQQQQVQVLGAHQASSPLGAAGDGTLRQRDDRDLRLRLFSLSAFSSKKKNEIPEKAGGRRMWMMMARRRNCWSVCKSSRCPPVTRRERVMMGVGPAALSQGEGVPHPFTYELF